MRKDALYSIPCLICFFSFYLGCGEAGDTKKKILFEQMQNVRAKEREIGRFDKTNYYDLCYLGFTYFSDAVMKKDMDNPEHRTDIQKALEFYSKAVAINKKLPNAYKGLFRVYYFSGDYKNALKNIKIAIEKDKGDFDAVFMLGNFYYQEGDLTSALEWFEKAKEILNNKPTFLSTPERKRFNQMIEKIKKKRGE